MTIISFSLEEKNTTWTSERQLLFWLILYGRSKFWKLFLSSFICLIKYLMRHYSLNQKYIKTTSTSSKKSKIYKENIYFLKEKKQVSFLEINMLQSFLQSPGIYYESNKWYIGSFYLIGIYMNFRNFIVICLHSNESTIFAPRNDQQAWQFD